MDLAKLFAALTGYRTHLATAGTMLTAVATLVGTINPVRGAMLIAICLGLAQTFQRLATANATNIIGTLTAEMERLRRLLNTTHPPLYVEPINWSLGSPHVEPINWSLGGHHVVPQAPQRDEPAQSLDSPVRPHASGMMLLAVSLCLGGSVCFAQDGVSIIGPTEVQAPGLPCELHLQGLDPLKAVAIAWKVFPPVSNVRMVEARDGGKVCRLTTIAGRWSVICTYHVEGEPIRFAEAHDVLVPGVPYTPSPGPTPPVPQPLPPAPVPTPQPPAPAPVLPAGEFDHLPTRVRDLATAVNSPTRGAEAAKLADALEGVAAQIAAGTLSGPQNIVNALGVSLNANTSAAWDDCRTKMVDALKSLYMGGKLKTTAAWATMLREVVTGLRAVR